MTCTRARKMAFSCGQCLSTKSLIFHHQSRLQNRAQHLLSSSPLVKGYVSKAGGMSISSPHRSGSSRYVSGASAARAKKAALDRDVIVSVLEVSATKRDAKSYLQKYINQPKSLADIPKFHQGDQSKVETPDTSQPLHVAIMKLRAPQEIDSETLHGVGKTLYQLQKLGLLSVVVVDCGIEESRSIFQDQVFRLCEVIDEHGEQGARIARDVFVPRTPLSHDAPSFLSADIQLQDGGLIEHILHEGEIPVIPSLMARDVTLQSQPVDPNKIVLALTRYFAGLQFDSPLETDNKEPKTTKPRQIAEVEKIILLDLLGAIPATGRRAWHRFINIEQEYDSIMKELMGPDGSPLAEESRVRAKVTAHAANLDLAKDALAMLPSTASALITTPSAAANLGDTNPNPVEPISPYNFGGMVITRPKKNPLLHSLLTDKPVFSSSLPVPRGYIDAPRSEADRSSVSTLLKRGMPLTVFPNLAGGIWRPPVPGGPRLRLTDNCVDLPRLVNLIEDSFNRKLDVEDYLNRVNDNLAGIIIAGEYEGGAILTWEIPEGLDEETAYKQRRLVPYLDKFAVLKRSQGSGGVADIVFNAMVRGCFPEGVCWRSRKDNPVNKWYFERSLGTQKLSDCNWTMFWTTSSLDARGQTLKDYESVCRRVEPSWADNRHILD